MDTLRFRWNSAPSSLTALAALGAFVLGGCSAGDAPDLSRGTDCVHTQIMPGTGVNSTSEAINLLLNQLPGDQSGAEHTLVETFGTQSDNTEFTGCPVNGSPDQTTVTMQRDTTKLTVTVNNSGKYTDLTLKSG